MLTTFLALLLKIINSSASWPDRLPAEDPQSVKGVEPAGESPIPTRVENGPTRIGNGDFSSARRGGWIRRKPECGPMKRSVRDYAPR
jgi:hypothetical protein